MVKLVAGDEGGLVKLVRLERETVQKWGVQARKNGVRCMAWTGNPGSRLGEEATVSAALRCGVVRTWDMSTQERVHDTVDAPEDAVHLSAIGASHLVLASEAGSVRVFAKDAGSAAVDACDWVASAGGHLSAAATQGHAAGALVASGGRNTRLRVWDVTASSASAAAGTALFEARGEHHDWLGRAPPVWVSGVAFLGQRGQTPDGAMPPVTEAALDARFESATDADDDDDDADGDDARADARSAAARRAAKRRLANVSGRVDTSLPAHWKRLPRPTGRTPIALSDEDEVEEEEEEEGSDKAEAEGATAVETSAAEDLAPWDTDGLPPLPPSRSLVGVPDDVIREAVVRRLVGGAPDVRLPAKDADWRPTPGHPSAVLVTVSRHRDVAVYDTRARRQAVLSRSGVGEWAHTCCAADPLARSVFVGDSIGGLTRLEMRRGLRVLHRYHGHAGAIRSIDVHPTMPLVASASMDRAVRVFHAETGALVRRVYLRQRQEACLFSRERRVRRPDYGREADTQDDRLGLVVRISSLQGAWRDAAEGKLFHKRPGEGEAEEPVEDDGVREADLEAAGVGAGAAADGGVYEKRSRSRREEEAEQDEAVWAELDEAARRAGPGHGEGDDDDDDDDDDAGSRGSDFDDELEGDEDLSDEAGGDGGRRAPKRVQAGASASASASKRARDADDDDGDSLGGDSLDGGDSEESDSESEESDEDGMSRMKRRTGGDEDLAMVDDRAALKRARKEAMRGRKRSQKAERVAELRRRTAERGGQPRR